jgi:hypothetical protein
MWAITFPTDSKERADFFNKVMLALRYGAGIGYENWSYMAEDADFDPLR